MHSTSSFVNLSAVGIASTAKACSCRTEADSQPRHGAQAKRRSEDKRSSSSLPAIEIYKADDQQGVQEGAAHGGAYDDEPRTDKHVVQPYAYTIS